MKIKVFTLHLDPETGDFDDRGVEAFLQERDALGVYHHFFAHDGAPTLALVVPYREQGRGRTAGPPRAPDGQLEIPVEDRPLFEALRHWRNERAKKDGRPSYILFNNGQLAAIARARPRTKQALGEVPGVGEGRLRDYADELLAIIAAAEASGG